MLFLIFYIFSFASSLFFKQSREQYCSNIDILTRGTRTAVLRAGFSEIRKQMELAESINARYGSKISEPWRPLRATAARYIRDRETNSGL